MVASGSSAPRDVRETCLMTNVFRLLFTAIREYDNRVEPNSNDTQRIVFPIPAFSFLGPIGGSGAEPCAPIAYESQVGRGAERRWPAGALHCQTSREGHEV